jgi:predicted dehydrogenase
MMKILVMGAGNIARRHIRNLKQLVPQVTLTLWRRQASMDDPELAAWIQRVVTTETEALAQNYDAAIIASPAPLHVPVAQKLAERGVHLLIEKPFSTTLAGIEALIATCAAKKIVLMVGYNLRFHAALQMVQTAIGAGRIGRVVSLRAEVGQYLPDWRPGKDYRQSVSAQRALGGGVVFELSHELDYLRWLGGEIRTVMAQTAHVSDLEMNVEDTADILLHFESGAVGSLHLDMVERAPYRQCRVTGTDGTLIWDAIAPSVKYYSAEKRAWEELFSPENFDRAAMYLDEMQHFLDCIHHQKTPIVSGQDAQRIVELALAVHQSAQTGQRIEV